MKKLMVLSSLIALQSCGLYGRSSEWDSLRNDCHRLVERTESSMSQLRFGDNVSRVVELLGMPDEVQQDKNLIYNLLVDRIEGTRLNCGYVEVLTESGQVVEIEVDYKYDTLWQKILRKFNGLRKKTGI